MHTADPSLAVATFLFCLTPDAYFCHGLMQMTTLVELDLSGNQIPQSLQQHLQVMLMLLHRVIFVTRNALLSPERSEEGLKPSSIRVGTVGYSFWFQFIFCRA